MVSDYVVSSATMTAIADAVRTAADSTITYTIDEMEEQLSELYFDTADEEATE